MTGPVPQFAYAQARLAARLGSRANEADWSRLAAITQARSFVEAAKRTPLARYLTVMSADQPIHAVERFLRNQWNEEVDDVGSWYPARYQPAFGWLSVLPLLPVIAHLIGEGATQSWMADEPRLAPFLEAPREKVPAWFADAGMQAFLPALSGDVSVINCWLAHWRSLWPSSPGDRQEFEAFASAILNTHDHQDAPASGLVDQDSADRVLSWIFRRHQRSIAAALAYLGLCALDLQRLRGEIAVRLLLPAAEPERPMA